MTWDDLREIIIQSQEALAAAQDLISFTGTSNRVT